MYNEQKKREFLSEQGTEGFKELFTFTEQLENRLNKDLFDFDLQEIEQIMHLFKPDKLLKAARIVNKIEQYQNWALINAYKENNVVYTMFATTDWYSKFVRA